MTDTIRCPLCSGRGYLGPAFSPRTAKSKCPNCRGYGRVPLQTSRTAKQSGNRKFTPKR